MSLVDRVRGTLLNPRQEWQVIDGEQTTAADLYRSYVAPLAAIGPVALAIGTLVFVRGAAPASVVVQAIIGFALSLGIVYVIAIVIDQLAPTFGGTRNMLQALKVSAYGCTAAFVAGIFSLIPPLGALGILGLYSVYQIYTGIPVLMRAPQDRALAYTAVVLGIVFVIIVVVSTIYLAMFTMSVI